MKMFYQKHGFIFSGKASDLQNLFKDYPAGITLLQYINLNLN